MIKRLIIYSIAPVDPRGRPQTRTVAITIFTLFKIDQNKKCFTAGRDCGLAEWIIDDSCLVLPCY